MVKKHSCSLDLIRGVSAIFVMIFHYTSRHFNEDGFFTQQGILLNWNFHLSWGYGAVATFFVLSGFLTSKLLFSCHANAGSYITNRLIRLFPTFWFCIFVTVVGLDLLLPDYQINIKNIFFNMTMIPEIFGISRIDGAYWTMRYELLFSVIIFVILLVKSINTRVVMLFLWIVSVILYNGLSDYILPKGIIYSAYSFIAIPGYAGFFIGGIALESLAEKSVNRVVSIGLFLGAVLCLLFSGTNICYIVFFIVTNIVIYYHKKIDIILPSNNLFIQILVFVAAISYPLYLTHQMLGVAFMKNMILLGLESEIWVLCPVVLAIMLGWVIHVSIELPMIKLGKILSQKYKI